MSRLFISHSSRNNAEALALQAWLQRYGWSKADVFLDIDPQRGIVAGQRWEAELRRAANRCEAVLCVITADWLESSYCRVELGLAKGFGKQIFGVIARPTPFDEIARKLPELTAEFQIVDLSSEGEQEEIAVELPPDGQAASVRFRREGLVRLRTGLLKAGLDARTFAFDPERPIYPGLKALEEKDAAIYFGREGKIVEGLDALRKAVGQSHAHVFAVVGASGSGKSSFLRAGLFPRLERDDRHWLPLPVVRPFNAILSNKEGLCAALETLYAAFGQRRAQGDLKVRIAEANGFVAILDELRALAHSRLLDEQAPLPTIVLSIDQGEELFDALQREGTAFFGLIAAVRAADERERQDVVDTERPQHPPRLVLLTTIRSDSFEKLQSNEVLSPPQGAIFSLPPLPKGAFKEVIEGPVRRLKEAKGDGALRLDDRLVEQLLDDVGGESADALPLLAFVLDRLFTDFGRSGELTLDHYERTGRMQGAIVAAVKKAFDEDDGPVIPADAKTRETLLKRAFIPWLARIDEASGEVKRNVAQWENIPLEARPLLERLVNVRLLRMHQLTDAKGTSDASQPRTVEPAHEALLRQWPDLVAWIKEERSNLLALEALLRAAGDWNANGRSGDWVTHKAGRLLDAEALARREDYAKKIDGLPRAYLASAREAEDSQRRAEREQIEREKKQLEEISAAQKLAADRLRKQTVAQRRVWAMVVVAVLVVLAGGFAIARIISGEGARMSSTLAQLSQAASDEQHYERAARYALAGLGRDQDLIFGYDAREAEVALRRAVFSSYRIARLQGHEGIVWAAWFSPDRERIVTASWDKTARVWDAATGNERARLQGHADAVLAASFSPDGKRIVTASKDKTARVWDAATGKELARLQGHDDAVGTASFSPDGRRIVTSSDITARVWDAATGKELARLQGHEGAVQTASYSPDGERIVTASWDKTARVWDAATGKELARLQGHEGIVWTAWFSPDGKRVVTASKDKTARVWDAATGKELARLQGHEDGVLTASFSPDGERIVTASQDKTARVWNAATGMQVARLQGHEGFVQTVSFSPDGKRIVTASDDKTAREWNAATGKEMVRLQGHDGAVATASYSPDGERIVTASWDKTARVWDATTSREIARPRRHEGAVESGSFTPDGRRIVTLWGDTARVREAATGSELTRLKGHDDVVRTASFSLDGRRIVTGSDDKTARVWDAATGSELTRLKGHDDVVRTASFSSDGKRVVTASEDKTARVWDAATGRELARLKGHEDVVRAASFSPDGRRIVTASSDQTARVWDATTGMEMVRLRGHVSFVLTASFSPDGKRIVTASLDKTARVWDAMMGKEQVRLVGHEEEVQDASFSPDGKRIVTASEDKTVRVWDVTTGKELARLQGNDSHVRIASFSLDGERIVTVFSNNTERVWDVQITSMPRDALTLRACQEVVLGELSKLQPEELTPAIDPTHDFDVEGDVCTPVSAWRRLLNSISGLGHARHEGAAAVR